MKQSYLLYAFILFALAISAFNYKQLHELRNTSSTRQATNLPQSRLDRVVSNSELRVGYIVFPPYMSKEATSDKLSGIFYDVTEKLGGNLGVKINWVEEVSLSTLAAGFKADRYDMIAFPLWRSAARAKNVGFSVPLFYSTVGVYVREGDNRFDKDLSLLNSLEIKVAAIDGELAEVIAKEDFPKAKIASMPQLVDYSQLLLEVSSGKADVTFYNRVFGNRFIAKNPGKVKDISGDRPIRVFAECFILPIDDTAFYSMVNAALLEMIENGSVDDAFRKNGENPAEYFRTAVPYRTLGL